jgi:hypothetical protein
MGNTATNIYFDGECWMVVPDRDAPSGRLLSTMQNAGCFSNLVPDWVFGMPVERDVRGRPGIRVYGDIERACMVIDVIELAGKLTEVN